MVNYYAHKTACIDDGAQIGEGTKIWHFSHVMPGAKIGKNCSLGQNVFVANNVEIGDGCKIQNNVSIYEGVILEDYVFCGPSMVFTNVKTPRCEFPRNTSDDYQLTVVKRGTSIGANATVVCGVTLYEYAFVAAGAVVTKDIPAYGMVTGVPAKLKGWMSPLGDILSFDEEGQATDSAGKLYQKISDKELVRVKPKS
ncbi:MAG: acyltransferase [Cyanobacteria bacterium P01_A01_bin.105]